MRDFEGVERVEEMDEIGLCCTPLLALSICLGCAERADPGTAMSCSLFGVVMPMVLSMLCVYSGVWPLLGVWPWLLRLLRSASVMRAMARESWVSCDEKTGERREKT